MAVSGASLYAGAAIAVGLFENFSPVIVAWFRVAAAGVILLILNRPKLRAFGGVAGRNAAIYGVMTMAMNMAFYQSLNHIPMGTAVAIEFLGPVVVAAWGSRRARDWIALFFAAAGVLVISGATWSDNAVGIIWALAAGLFWAGYIVISSHIAADKENSRASMAVGFSYAGLLALPVMILIWPDDPGLPGITVLGLAAGLGLLSAAIPYSLDQVVLRMAGSSYFALLQAILPVVAAVVGALALGQWLTTAEIIGIVLIIIAVGMRRN
ncbi:EamA family transporter [Corynebacteriaceae bacterium 6-324]